MRIVIFGKPGSGKTTFAFALSLKLKIPLYHLDKYFYESKWVERDYNEFLRLQKHLVAQENWIIDGNNTKSLEMRYQRATVILYFCYPWWQVLWRIFKRRFFSQKNPMIDDRAVGCPETIRWSLLKYTLTYEKRLSLLLTTLRKKYSSIPFYIISSDKELSFILKFLFEKAS